MKITTVANDHQGHKPKEHQHLRTRQRKCQQLGYEATEKKKSISDQNFSDKPRHSRSKST